MASVERCATPDFGAIVVAPTAAGGEPDEVA